MSSRVFAFAVRRVSARCRSFARLCFSLAMPCHAVPSPLRAVPFLCRAVPTHRCSYQRQGCALRYLALPFRCFAPPSLIRSCLRSSDSDQIQAAPLLCQLMLRYACAYSAFPMRGEAMLCQSMPLQFASIHLFALPMPFYSMRRLCSSLRIKSIADRRISAANQIVSSPRPFNSALRLCISIRNYTFPLRRLAARAFPQLSPW